MARLPALVYRRAAEPPVIAEHYIEAFGGLKNLDASGWLQDSKSAGGSHPGNGSSVNI